MSVARSCAPCRTAKAKCDFVRPSCGRCMQRGLVCTGYADELDFIFRNENEAAERNSRRARAGRGSRNQATPVDLEIFQQQRSRTSPGIPELTYYQRLYPWLNDIALHEASEPLRRDIESRAVDRLFVNWTLYPCNEGMSAGYMHDLPRLFQGAPSDSILRLIVRATAFADMKQYRTTDNVSFATMALQHYGAALRRLRTLAADEQDLANDRVLAALLLLDNFESMYLGRTEPLGPHSNAVRLILRERGYSQFLDRSSFCLWRMAHERIQARQILLREEPDPEQVEWLNKLDHGVTYLRISSDIHQINTVASAVIKLIQSGQSIRSTIAGRKEEAYRLIVSSHNLINSIEQWIADVGEQWRPKVVAGNCVLQESDRDAASHPSLPDFLCPRMLSYSDIWLAYIWNFHAASQIVLRESLVDTVQFKSDLEMRESSTEDEELIRAQYQGVQRLSSSIIRSFPQLLGFVHRDVQPPHALPQGKMAGRYFSLFSLSIVQKARFTSAEHKQTATEVLNWIKSSHQLT